MPPFWRHLLAGFSMGAADVVPGVSGGTVALLFGIYARLIKAITHFDRALLQLLGQRRWSAAAKHIDLPFLAPLAGGLLLGLATSILTIKQLLEHDATRPATLAWFCGMIVASAGLMTAAIKPKEGQQKVKSAIAMLCGIGLAAWVGMLPAATSDAQPSLGFIFLCGMIGICAMILPGISGAMILLLLGLYSYLLSLPEKLLDGGTAEALSSMTVFALGCATGLVIFSRLLNWLLNRHEKATLSVLVGLMIGSLVRLWPFQAIQEAEGHETVKYVLPSAIDLTTTSAVVSLLVGLGSILAVHAFARALAQRSRKSVANSQVERSSGIERPA